MSPSLSATRPAWVWSLPAFAIILSFLWYRKKRGSLKTDSGGETNDQPSKKLEANITVLNNSEITNIVEEFEDKKKVEEEKEEEEKQVVEEIFDRVKVDSKVETVPSSVEVCDTVFINHLYPKEEITDSKTELHTVIDITRDIEDSVVFEEKLEEENQIEENKCSEENKFIEMAKKSSDSSLDQRKNNASILEQKLSKLDLTSQCSSNNEADEKQRNEDMSERDSANNSPSEVMLASPSVSGYSDTNSVGSSDSGKGCSEVLTPSRTPASGNSVSGDLPATSMYEFVIPQQLVGRLIGRHGSYVNEIKEATHASIYIKRHPDTPKLKICAVLGTQMDIESALDMIRHKFPKKRYPNVTLEQVVIAPEPQLIPIISENMQLYLVEGINNDVILSSLVSAGHFFVQQPTHPTYLSLSRLNYCMAQCYSEPDQPTIPEGVGAGVLCAAPAYNGWYRAQITNMEYDMCDIKFVDYGGYMTTPVSALRQIRVDFINLPFQASECYLAGVKPSNEENIWCEEAKELVEKLTYGKVLQAQVYGYAEDGVPLIYLHTVDNDEVVLINQELVNRGFAEWIYWEPVTDEVKEAEEPAIEETEPVAIAV